jgi:hypothetical protein
MNKDSRLFLWVWFLFIAGAGLRMINLNQSLGGGDENQYLLDYGDTSLSYIASSFFFGGHHIFHTLIMRLMIMAFGDENAIAIRLPVFLSGLGTLYVIYKISQTLFKSKITPIVSLAILALCPIHIYYSNTARGYSVIIFFSALMVLSALRIFQSGRFGFWGVILSLSAFLSTYTIATNVYFVFGLGSWVAAMVFIPWLFKKTGFLETSRNEVFCKFFAIFIVAGLLTLCAYWPVLGNMAQEANSYHLPMTKEPNSFLTVYRIIEELFKLILEGSLLVFVPFLFLGIFWGNVKFTSYRALTVCILVIPLLIPLITGVGGYARNFLFTIPMIIPFLGEGLVVGGIWAEKLIKRPKWFYKYGVVTVFFVVAVWQILFTYFNLQDNGFDPKRYKKDLKRLTSPLDLVIVTDPNNFWYSHNVYKENLRRSLFLNKLSGIKAVSENKNELFDFKLNDGFSYFPIFRFLQGRKIIPSKTTDRGLSVFTLNERNTVRLFEKDFESQVIWLPINGDGKVEVDQRFVLAGDSALNITNYSSREIFIVEGAMNRVIEIRNPMFAVMLWGGMELNKQKPEDYNLAVPTLILESIKTKKNLALRMGKVNDGIANFINQKSEESSVMWLGSAFMGIILPGDFNLKLQIAAFKGQSVNFDAIRLFLFDVPS